MIKFHQPSHEILQINSKENPSGTILADYKGESYLKNIFSPQKQIYKLGPK